MKRWLAGCDTYLILTEYEVNIGNKSRGFYFLY